MRAEDNVHTPAGKRKLIKTFMDSIRDELMGKAGLMPAEWDGFELRWLVEEKVRWEAEHSRKGRLGRVKTFRNEMRVRNL